MAINKLSIGNDIVEVDRIHQLSNSHGQRFLSHVFTRNEIEWCQKRQAPHIHFAGKFAAKEAVKKALMSMGESETIPLKSIEINRSEGKPPTVNVLCDLSSSYQIKISIAHTDLLATAVAIVQVT